jgi:hypothetical protein
MKELPNVWKIEKIRRVRISQAWVGRDDKMEDNRFGLSRP